MGFRKLMLVLGVAAIALTAIACGTDEPSSSPTGTAVPDSNSDAGLLVEAQARWAGLNLGDYDFRMSWQCFCDSDFRAPVDLEVRGGEITGGVYAPDSALTTVVDLSRYETVDGLFDLIADAIAQEAHSIQATYHPEHGYPESVFIDYSLHTVDEESGFAITKVTAAALGNTVAPFTLTTDLTAATSDYDYKSLIDDLASAGATVEEVAGPPESPIGFSVGGPKVVVNGGMIQVHEFPDDRAADAEAGYVSPDGYNITVPLGGDRSMSTHSDWLAPPHYYKMGRVIVRYVGDSMAVLEVLDAVLGPQFAGQ